MLISLCAIVLGGECADVGQIRPQRPNPGSSVHHPNSSGVHKPHQQERNMGMFVLPSFIITLLNTVRRFLSMHTFWSNTLLAMLWEQCTILCRGFIYVYFSVESRNPSACVFHGVAFHSVALCNSFCCKSHWAMQVWESSRSNKDNLVYNTPNQQIDPIYIFVLTLQYYVDL